MIIDIHTHIYPDRIAAETVRALAAKPGLDPASDGTVTGLKNSMASSGVACSFIMPVATNPLKVNKLNDFAFTYDGTDGLYSFGAIHPECEYWKDELERIKDHGLKGIKIHPVYQKTDFDDARYLRIFEYAAKLDLFVLSHTGMDIGFPHARNCTTEKLVNALRLTGGFKVILAHMAGWEMWNEALEMLTGKDVYIDTAFSLGEYRYIESQERDPDIRAAFGSCGHFIDDKRFVEFVDSFGADHILFGSDSPWEAQKNGINFIESVPISDEKKQLILGGNAERLFLS